MRLSRLVLTVLALALLTSAAPSAGWADEPHQENSINVNPIGVLFGSYSLNFEHLFAEQHGLLAEGTFATSSSGTTSTVDGGFAVGYRWHWSKSQNSGFLGANLGYRLGSAKATVDSSTFDLNVSVPYAVFNIGRRFAWDFGLNVTLRAGLGRGFYSISSTSTNPNVQSAIKTVEDVYNRIPVVLDGEVSIGYDF